MDISKETRPSLHFTLATAGHVDHGKTSVLRTLTGIDPDRLKEEKERQMTTDLGFAHMRITANELSSMSAAARQRFASLYQQYYDSGPPETSQRDSELVVGFIDVPGHGKFLKNMLAGVGGIDMALVVVAADEGPMPQTIQHLKILSLLGIHRCILVLTKIDLASESEIESAMAQTRDLLRRLRIELVAESRVSNSTGDGFDSLRREIAEHVLRLPLRTTVSDTSGKKLPTFLAVDRVFSKSGYGVVVTGTLVHGNISVGDNVFIEPGHIGARVRGLETFKDRLAVAYPGQRLAINMSLKENKPLERGHTVVGRKSRCTRTLIVTLADLGGIEAKFDSSSGRLKPQPVRLYHGTAERAGELRWLERLSATENGSAEEQSRPETGAGKEYFQERFVAQISLEEPVMARPGDRFVIRYGDFGIAGGDVVLTTRPRWLNRSLLSEIAEMVSSGDLASACLAYLEAAPQKSVKEEDLLTVLPDFRQHEIVESLLAEKKLTKLANHLLSSHERETLESTILEALAARADDEGLSQESVRVEIAPLLERSIFQSIVKELVDRGAIVKEGERLAIRSDASAAPASQEEIEKGEQVISALQGELCLEIKELSGRAGISGKELERILQRLEQAGRLFVVNYDFVSSSESIEAAHNALARIWTRQRSISPSDFRQEVGTSRKYAMALLAFFDDTKVTRRLDSGRVLLKAPKKKE